ncbi:hypothetical protein FQZ97_1240180 [compost metagenome]
MPAMFMVRRMITDDRHIGMMCRRMTRVLDAPWSCTATTKSALRSGSVSARASRAIGGHAVSAMAITACSSPGPRAAMNANARTRLGKEMKMSVMRMNRLSTQPPK